MFVLGEDEYKEFKRMKATLAPTSVETSVKCPVCSREYPNETVMAHHLKSHVDGFKCNICGKVFKLKQSLSAHLQKHAPQVAPSKNSVLHNYMHNQPSSESAPVAHHSAPALNRIVRVPHHADAHVRTVSSIKPRKPHKRKSVINFTVKKWLTLQ